MRTGAKGKVSGRPLAPQRDARDRLPDEGQALLDDLIRVSRTLADCWTEEAQKKLTRCVARWDDHWQDKKARGAETAMSAVDIDGIQTLLRSLRGACEAQRESRMEGAWRQLTDELAALVKSMPEEVVLCWEPGLLAQIVSTLESCGRLGEFLNQRGGEAAGASDPQRKRKASATLEHVARDRGHAATVDDFSELLGAGTKLLRQSADIADQLKARPEDAAKYETRVREIERLFEQGWPRDTPRKRKTRDIAGGAGVVGGLLKSGLAAYFPRNSKRIVGAWLGLVLAGSKALSVETNIVAALNAIKAVVEDKSGLSESAEVKERLVQALPSLLELTCSDSFRRHADPKHIANALNCIKAVVEHKASWLREDPAVKAQLKKTLPALLALTCADSFQPAKPQAISNAMNCIKAVVKDEATWLREDPTVKAQLKKTLPILLALCSDSCQETADAQHIANALNCIKVVVEDKATWLCEDPAVKAQLKKALPILLAQTCSEDFDENANPQEIASALNCIKAVVKDEATWLRDDPMVKARLKKALPILLALTRSKYFRHNADPQAIANSLACIKAVVEDKATWLREDPTVKAQLKKTLPILLALTCSEDFRENAGPQHTANALNCIKAVVEDKARWLRKDPTIEAPLKKTLPILLALTCSKNFMENAQPQAIANVLNCIRATVEDERTWLREDPAIKAQLKNALQMLLALTCSEHFQENAQPQAVANALNCIKAVVEGEATWLREDPAIKALLKKALPILLALTCSEYFGKNAKPQDVANALNCTKAVVSDPATWLCEDPAINAPLKKALPILLPLTCSEYFRENAQPQHIANALNCIKAMVENEATWLREDPAINAQLKKTLPILLVLTCSKNFKENAQPQAVANALNCIKAVMEDEASWLREDPTVKAPLEKALPALLRATCTNAFRDEASSQSIANVLFDLQVLHERGQPFVATHAKVLADSARATLALVCLGRVDAMHPINRSQLRIALRGLTEQEVLTAGEHAVQVMIRALYQRMTEQGPTVDGLKPNELGNRIWLCAQLHSSQLMSSDEFDGLAPLFAAQVSRMLALPAGQTQEDVAARLWLLESAARLHGKLVRSSPGAAAMLDEAMLKAVQLMDWPRVARPQLRTELGDCCAALTHVLDRMRADDARRPPWEMAIVSAARALAPLIPEGEINVTQAHVIVRFVPEGEWTSLRMPTTGLARQREIVYGAWRSLKGDPVPMVSSKPIELPVLRSNGRPVLSDGQPKALTYESLVFQELFGDEFTPVLIELPKFMKPGTVPLVVKHKGRLYRTELFRGSKNKPEEGELPQLICVPVESGEFFANWWLTSKESRTYAQRAFLNGQVGKAQAASDKAVQSQGAGALKGRFGVAVVPDDKAAQFVPKGPSQHLRVRDGCGFIKRSLAEQLIGREQLAKQLELACVNGKPSDKGLSGQALHHYPVRPEQAMSIAQEFVRHAKRQLVQPLKDSRTLPEPATLAHASAMGKAPIFHRKAVPSADHKLRLPDTPEWNQRAAEGVIVTRPPQDTENLLFVARSDIEFVPPTLVLQHSLTGYRKVPREGDGLLQQKAGEFHQRQQELGKQQGIELPDDEQWLQSLFFKGQLMIVDDPDWPDGFSKQQIVVSAKDLKTSNLMDGLDTKKKMQNPQQTSTFTMRGCLAFKQLNVGVAVPEKMQADLGGDYDGDDLGILPAAEFPELTKLVIERQPHKRRNAKMPKTFTPALKGEWDVTKIEQILLGLTGKSAVASRAYYAAPEALVNPLYQDAHFLQGEVVQNLMELVQGDDPWYVKAGWKDAIDLANPVHARLLLERELELLEKAGTDLEKTDLPVPLLIERCKRYMSRLQEHGRVAWGKGLEKKLKAAQAERAAGDDERTGDPSSADSSLEDLREAYAEILLAMLEHTQTQRGLPAAITMAIMDWYLQGFTPRRAADDAVSPISSVDDDARALRQEGGLRLEGLPDLNEELPAPMLVVRPEDWVRMNRNRTLATLMPPGLQLNTASWEADELAEVMSHKLAPQPLPPGEPDRTRVELPPPSKPLPDTPPSTWRTLLALVRGFERPMGHESRRRLLDEATRAATTIESIDGNDKHDVLDLAHCPATGAAMLCDALAEVARSDGETFSVHLTIAPPTSVTCVPLEGFSCVWTLTGLLDDSMEVDASEFQVADTLLTDTYMRRCEAIVQKISAGDLYDPEVGQALRDAAMMSRFRSDLSDAQRARLGALRRDARQGVELLLRKFVGMPVRWSKAGRVHEALHACVESNVLEPGNDALIGAYAHLDAVPV